MSKVPSSSYKVGAGPTGKGIRIVVGRRKIVHADPFVYIASEAELWHDGTPRQRTRAALRIIQAAVHALQGTAPRRRKVRK